jgi:hypothetical protein
MPVTTPGRRPLLTAAALAAAIALLHVGTAVAGAPAYRYFGAPELAPLAERGSPVPALVTLALALAFAACALWAASGAGLVRRLPLLRLGIAAAGVVFTARGLALPFELAQLARGGPLPPRYAVFSLVSLVTGVCYLLGTRRTPRGALRP